MELDLSKIKNEVAKGRKKKGKMKPYSLEDEFMLAGVQPASKSKNCTNSYKLTMKANYDTCCGMCDNYPDGALPLTIVPIHNPSCFGIILPANWAPKDCGSHTVKVTKHEKPEIDIKDKILAKEYINLGQPSN